MAIPTITIGGSTRQVRNGTPDITEILNSKSSFECDVDTPTGSYRPAKDDEIVVDDSGTTIFGGVITEASERALTDNSNQSTWTTHIRADDFSVYTTRQFAYGIRSTELLKTRLQWLVNTYLDDYGISLHVGQPDGPVLPSKVYEDMRIDEVLNEMSVLSTTASGTYVWQITYTKVLAMDLPGGLIGGGTAPFNVTDSDVTSNAIGDITVEPIQSDFANRIILRAGQGVHDATDTFTGNGSTTKFVLTIPFVGNASGFVTYDGNLETFAVKDTGFNLAVFWLYDPSDNSINRVSAPANTKTISITYQAQFPIRVQSDAGAAAANVVVKVIEEPTVFDKTFAQSLSDAYLLTYNQTYKAARYQTLQSGVHPGQTQTITKSSRNLNSTCLVTEVHIRQIDNNVWMRDVTVNVGTSFLGDKGSWRDTIKQWNGSDRSYGGQSTTALITTTGSNFAEGYPIDVAFSAGNFTGGGGWTLTSGDQVTFAYTLSGPAGQKTMKVWLSLVTTSVTGGGGGSTKLSVTIPGSYTGAKTVEGTYHYTDNGTHGTGIWEVLSTGTTIDFYPANGSGSANWAASTNNTGIFAEISFPVI